MPYLLGMSSCGSGSPETLPDLDMSSSLSFLECSPSSVDHSQEDQSVKVLVSRERSLLLDDDDDEVDQVGVSYRGPQHEELLVFSPEFHQAYANGTLHSFLWKRMITNKDLITEEPVWTGHRPLDPAYPSPSRLRRRPAPRFPTQKIALAHEVKHENDDVEIVLSRVCASWSFPLLLLSSFVVQS
jgi:hypothetical protein